MKVLKKLPKWAVAVLLLVLIGIMASAFARHITTSGRVNERKNQIQQRQQSIFQSTGRSPDDEWPVKVPEVTHAGD